MRLGSAQGDVKVITGGGIVELWKVGQGAYVETGGGQRLRCSSWRTHQFRDSYLHTALGNVVVYLPRDLGVNVHASTEMASGMGIKSEFSGLAIYVGRRAVWAKVDVWRRNLNGGGPILRMRTTIGQIDIRKLQ